MVAMLYARIIARPAAAAVLVVAAVILVAGCDTGPLFRDNYWGKSVLQPDQVLQPVPRDGLGNPVLDDDGAPTGTATGETTGKQTDNE